MDNSQKTSLILHGHFYQPPRENPDTGIIPLQPSASPYLDWNERIYDDCYGANLASRYLDYSGKILSLSNNYSYISFNFGPTLLHWLDEKHPEIVEGLKDADRSSLLRLGHGNAMAQGFNHTILPLDHPDNARLQIDWGIKDFQFHYGRDPEGMWLPECGINETVVQLLSEAGIKFVVLSPWQCRAVEGENGKMKELGASPAPYTEPYILTGKNGGTVTAFFYEPSLASGISFGHFLRSADNLYDRLLEMKNNSGSSIIHTATDGEIYGHHEPFGDMALAALIKKINDRNDFILDNYGSYMEKHPAVRHAILRPGEDAKGSSWSCSHGVSRWYKDCGCHTGGPDHWNQKWRTGLRKALNNLGTSIDEIFGKEVERIFNGRLAAMELLKAAGNVFCGKIGMIEFTTNLQKEYGLSDEDRIVLSHLLSGMKYKHFSFTSCGFFFSDLSGIEPRHDIKYAIHAISLFQQFTDKELMIPFLHDLQSAKSNIREEGDGMVIAQSEMEGLKGEVESVVFFALNRIFSPRKHITSYGKFRLMAYDEDGEWKSIRVMDSSTGEEYSFKCLPSSGIETGISLYIARPMAHGQKSESYHITNKDVPERVLTEAFTWIDNTLATIPRDTLLNHINMIQMYSTLLENNPNEVSTRTIETLGLSIRCVRSIINNPSQDLKLEERLDAVGQLLVFIGTFGREKEKALIKDLLEEAMLGLYDSFKDNGMTKANVRAAIMVLESARSYGHEPNLKKIQNCLYPYYQGKLASTADKDDTRKLFSLINFK